MPYVSPHEIEDVKRTAAQKLQEEDFKIAVEAHKNQLKAQRLRYFSKRIRLQWPVRFEPHYQPLNRRRTDKGRTS